MGMGNCPLFCVVLYPTTNFNQMKLFYLLTLSLFIAFSAVGQTEYYNLQIKRINKAISNSDFVTAKRYLDIAEQKFPDSSRVYLEKAGYYYFQDSLDLAMDNFLKAESLGSPNVQINKYVGLLHDRNGAIEKARKRYRIYLNEVPEDVLIWSKYALILFEAKEYDQLIAECSDVDTTNQFSANVYGMLCNAYASKSEHEMALQNILIARRLDPFNQQWQYYEAVVHHNLENEMKSCDLLHTLMDNGYFEYYTTYEEFDCEGVLDVYNSEIYQPIDVPPPPQEIIEK